MKILVNESTHHIIFVKIRKELEQRGTLELSDDEAKDPEVQHYFNQRMVSFKGAEAPKAAEAPKVVEPVKERTPTQPTTPVPEVKKEEPKPAPAPTFDTKKK